MWQTIAVGIIGIAVVFWIGFRLWRWLKRPPSTHPCDHCAGCPLTNKGKCSPN